MAELYIIREHHEILSLWRRRKAGGIRLLHLDFHDDMRGFLIDRMRGIAHRTGIVRPDRKEPDEGNFLVHAVMEGFVSKIRWVRGRIGGRAYESGIVRYTEDLASLPHQVAHFLRKDMEYRLEFNEILYESWDGLFEDEQLDIDWDFFASCHLNPQGMKERFSAFFEKAGNRVPPVVYFCYSPGHVHPSRLEFLASVQELSERYDAAPQWPGGNFIPGLPSALAPRKPATPIRKLVLYLRKKGIY
jgi:hypothetical protein